MGSRYVIILVFLLSFCIKAVGDVMWTYEPGAEQIERYKTGRFDLDCSTSASKDSSYKVFHVLRDAAIYKIEACYPYALEALNKFKNNSDIAIANEFYMYRIGKTKKLDRMMLLFENSKLSDSLVIEFLGFVENWDLAGRKLLSLLKSSDGSKSQMICSALAWKRGLYGEVSFKTNYFRIGKEVGLGKKVLNIFYEDCIY